MTTTSWFNAGAYLLVGVGVFLWIVGLFTDRYVQSLGRQTRDREFENICDIDEDDESNGPKSL